MVRLFIPTVGGLLSLALYVFALFDVIATDSVLVRNLPKITWLLIVLMLPPVGAIAWLALGRPVGAGFTPGATRARPNQSWLQERGYDRPRPRGPEDRDDWRPASGGAESAAARERRLQEWEAQLRAREDQLGGDDETE